MTKGAFGSKKFIMKDGYAVGVVRPTRQFGSKAKIVKGIKKAIANRPRIDDLKTHKRPKGLKGVLGRVFQRKGE